MTEPLQPIPIAEIEAARARIADVVRPTPLLPLGVEIEGREIFLKLENLHPIGSFKLRGAVNAVRSIPAAELAAGVYTASAGNMAQGLAFAARALGVPCTVVVPEHAPATKLAAVERLGGRVVKLPFAQWWQVLVDHGLAGQPGRFVHPVSDATVIAGNGTLGLELVEQLDAFDAVLVPWGGGGLSCGIACALKTLRPGVRTIACEVSTAAPLSASFAAGEAATIEYVPSFVDGIGGRSVLPEMWPLAQEAIDAVEVVEPAEIAEAIRVLIERNRVVAEGAGAAAVAAALAGRVPGRRLVCVVSGGNIDPERLAGILRREPT